MSEINIYHTLWEFTERKEDKDNFIQKTLTVSKVFKVKSLKTQSLMIEQRRQRTICFEKTKKGQKRVAGC